jgi:hypothetical protein
MLFKTRDGEHWRNDALRRMSEHQSYYHARKSPQELLAIVEQFKEQYSGTFSSSQMESVEFSRLQKLIDDPASNISYEDPFLSESIGGLDLLFGPSIKLHKEQFFRKSKDIIIGTIAASLVNARAISLRRPRNPYFDVILLNRGLFESLRIFIQAVLALLQVASHRSPMRFASPEFMSARHIDKTLAIIENRSEVGYVTFLNCCFYYAQYGNIEKQLELMAQLMIGPWIKRLLGPRSDASVIGNFVLGFVISHEHAHVLRGHLDKRAEKALSMVSKDTGRRGA